MVLQLAQEEKMFQVITPQILQCPPGPHNKFFFFVCAEAIASLFLTRDHEFLKPSSIASVYSLPEFIG